MSTSCYSKSGVSHLESSVCLMVVTYLHTICNLKVVHLFYGIFNLGPRAVFMLRAPHRLNPALVIAAPKNSNIISEAIFCFYSMCRIAKLLN